MATWKPGDPAPTPNMPTLIPEATDRSESVRITLSLSRALYDALLKACKGRVLLQEHIRSVLVDSVEGEK